MTDNVRSFLERIYENRSPWDYFEGCTDEDIEAIRIDQGVIRIPSEYCQFLRKAGRGAGPLLRGTDAFYPGILGIKHDAQELLVQSGTTIVLGPESLVVAMHQGYQIYWIPDVLSDAPLVLMYQEGDREYRMEWSSIIEYLHDMLGRVLSCPFRGGRELCVRRLAPVARACR